MNSKKGAIWRPTAKIQPQSCSRTPGEWKTTPWLRDHKFNRATLGSTVKCSLWWCELGKPVTKPAYWDLRSHAREVSLQQNRNTGRWMTISVRTEETAERWRAMPIAIIIDIQMNQARLDGWKTNTRAQQGEIAGLKWRSGEMTTEQSFW